VVFALQSVNKEVPTWNIINYRFCCYVL